jgi:hypothetical protein
MFFCEVHFLQCGYYLRDLLTPEASVQSRERFRRSIERLIQAISDTEKNKTKQNKTKKTTTKERNGRTLLPKQGK